MSRSARVATTAMVVALALVALPPARATAEPNRVAGLPGPVRSVVVLGDSVAAGEGARDGYRYRNRPVWPEWARLDGRPAAAGDDGCGRSDAAYGVLVAGALGADVTNLACSGAGLDEVVALDARYDAARPDLVLVTAGANSVDFERAYAYCVLAARGLADGEAARIVRSGTVRDASAAAIEVGARRALAGRSPDAEPACTAANPGAYLEATVLGRLGTVGRRARALVAEIRARGRAAGRVPAVVFTTYPDPLPRSAAALWLCPDGAGLGADQVAFARQLVGGLNEAVRDALEGVRGVRVVDPGPAFAGHRWCDPDPWVHGPSIFLADPTSRAPFHPTAAGQRAIAAAVLAALDRRAPVGDLVRATP